MQTCDLLCAALISVNTRITSEDCINKLGQMQSLRYSHVYTDAPGEHNYQQEIRVQNKSFLTFYYVSVS